MPYGLYLSAEGAYTQSQRLDVLSNNIANVATPGFKRDVALFQSRLAQAIQEGQAAQGTRGINDLGGGVKVLATATDFSAGPLSQSKNDTDMAINGEGFFLVRHGNRELLTRAGNFQVTSAGQLVTQDGDPVLSEDHSPIEIDSDAGPWQVNPDGSISQGGENTRLALVKPRSLGDLVKVGENLFSSLAPAQPLADDNRQVLWHSVEQSTVHPASEMMDLIETSRAFEANVNMIHTYDSATETLINGALRQTS
ncbi:MAG TPA: flagellar basal-body rod protein FlgF [Pirellulales bacterium]|jgi:flagellar basal-body rod protein FlgF|nr:flagellar basal-body rod protein FlgF [Pirellulales bacterium]